MDPSISREKNLTGLHSHLTHLPALVSLAVEHDEGTEIFSLTLFRGFGFVCLFSVFPFTFFHRKMIASLVYFFLTNH